MNEKPTDTQRKKRFRKNAIYVFIFICLVALVAFLIFSFGDLSRMAGAFTEMVQGGNVVYLILAILCGVAFFALYPLPLLLISRKSGLKSKTSDLYLIGNCEHFYNGVTPSSVGGQPFQAFALHQSGDDGGKATGVILMNYINIVLCSVLFGFISLIYYPRYVQGLSNIQGLDMDLSSLQWIAVAGIILNSVNLAFFTVLGFSKTSRRIISALFRLITKPKFLRKLFKFQPALDAYLEKTQSAAKEVIKHWKAFILAVVLRMVILCFCYAIPFFLMMAMPSLQIGIEDFWVCLLGNAFATVCVAWFPTPGAVGAGELVGAVVLGSITVGSGQALDYNVAQAVSLLSRGISFYMVLIFSFIASLVFEIRVGKMEKVETKPEETVPSENKEEGRE